MTSLEAWIQLARSKGASDLHLEPRLPVTLRVRGKLYAAGAAPGASELSAEVKALLGESGWAELVARGSADLARTLAGVRCRINALRSARGVGLAVRLLPAVEPSIASLNLHPSLEQLAFEDHGLVIVSGATGSGKSSTLAALVGAINARQAKHVLTIEQPIEYTFRSNKAFVRQREVGRDTPSFARALVDALREDPDVILVGEMRDRETMRRTLDAAETGHLVLATLHSSDSVDALRRIVAAFPAEEQESVRAQLADVLRGVVCQRLLFRPEIGIRAAECEVLLGTNPARNLVRSGELFKLRGVLETGSGEGHWSFERYRAWLDERTHWELPERVETNGLPVVSDFGEAGEAEPPAGMEPVRSESVPGEAEGVAEKRPAGSADPERAEDDVIVLQPPDESIEDILSEL